MKLKPQTQVGEWEYIASTDPAVAWPEKSAEEKPEDWEKRKAAFVELLRRARETGDYGPVLREGRTPAVWRFQHLRSRQRAWFRDQLRSGKGTHELALDAVSLALVGVTGKAGPDGQPIDIKRAAEPELRGWVAVVEDQRAWLELDPDTMVNLGNHVVETLLPQNG